MTEPQLIKQYVKPYYRSIWGKKKKTKGYWRISWEREHNG